MTLRRNVLIFHSGALGDFVLTWPLALALGRVFPQSRVFYVTQGQKGALAERVLRVESVDVEGGGWHHLFAEAPDAAASLPERSAKLLAGAHRVFTFVAGADSAWARNVAALSPGVEVVPLTQQPPDGYAGHVAEHVIDQLAAWPAWAEAVRQLLRSVEQRGAAPALVPAGDTVVIHPGSGAARKNWPAERFLELGRRLKADGRPVRFVLGDVEAERWGDRAAAPFSAVGEVRQPATLLELLASLGGAAAFVGNDSGPGHLAGALGVPTVSLFGPSDPARWRPLGPRVRVVRGATMEEITVDEVLGALRGSS